MEMGEDPRLRLGGEVHERVAAHEEVEAGNRGVLNQVVAAEDDRPAKVVPEDEAAARSLEIGFAELAGNGAEILGRVAAQASVLQRLLVGVGRVDLDPLLEALLAQQLGE